MRTKDFAFKLQSVQRDGTFNGYGSVFGIKDSYDEIVAPGAFSDTLSRHKTADTMPAMLWQHRSGEPIGAYMQMSEDSIGLKLEGQLELKTARGAEAYALMSMQPRPAINGLSIGFVPRMEQFDKVTGITTLTAVDLWEVSLVTFPANDAARVQGVKALEALDSLKSAEQYLRDTGLSRREAMLFISRVKSLSQSESEDSMQPLIDAIARRNAIFNV